MRITSRCRESLATDQSVGVFSSRGSLISRLRSIWEARCDSPFRRSYRPFETLVTAASGRSNHTGPGVFAPDITHKSAQELGMCSYKKQEGGFFQWKEL